jgi:outer membrane protein assembly factor BamB
MAWTATGEARFGVDVGFRPRSSPAVVDGTLVVGSDDGHAYGLEIA